MIGTYAAVLAVCVASLAIGQAAMALCGVAALVVALAGGRPGAALRDLLGNGAAAGDDGVVSAVARAAADRRRGRSISGGALEGGGEALRIGAAGRAVARCGRRRCLSSSKATSASSAPASTPTCPSTCSPPTGSPTAHGSQLLHQGYPLGPHAIVVALNKGLGIGLVQGFTRPHDRRRGPRPADRPRGLRRPAGRLARSAAGALVVGLAYMVASYFAQGAFKETMQALFVLAFVLALREASPNPAGATCRCASSPPPCSRSAPSTPTASRASSG